VSLNVDADEPADEDDFHAQALLRFDAIFGSEAAQIPAGSEIISAQLALNVTNSGASMDLHRMQAAWADTNTWSSFGGIQPGDEAELTADVSTDAVGTGVFTIDVTKSLQAWTDQPIATNFGWAFLPTGTDGVDFDSAEGATSPKLTVTFVPGTPNDPPVANDDSYNTEEDLSLSVVHLAYWATKATWTPTR
jgi:hypothetical protein